MKDIMKNFSKRYFADGIIAFLLYNTVYDKFLSPLFIDWLETLGASILMQRFMDVTLFILGFGLYQMIVKDGKEHLKDIQNFCVATKRLLIKAFIGVKNITRKATIAILRKVGNKCYEIVQKLEENQ